MLYSYLSKYADPSDEPSSPPYDQSFEDMDLAVENWKGLFKKKQIIIAIMLNVYFFFRIGIPGSNEI